MNEESVERIAAELARLAEALRALRQPALPAAAESLAHTAPPDLSPLVRQTLTALAQLLPGEGVRVLLAGLHRRGDRTTSWYQFLSEKDAQKALQNPAGLRALTLLAQPERLRLLFALVQGVQGTAEAMEKSGLTQGQFYHHLRALEAAGLVRKLGRDRYVPTISGTSALFTLLALVDHLGREAEEEP